MAKKRRLRKAGLLGNKPAPQETPQVEEIPTPEPVKVVSEDKPVKPKKERTKKSLLGKLLPGEED